ncbi:MAG: TlpA disulfide reductase family protein [Fuerstiella sp.]
MFRPPTLVCVATTLLISQFVSADEVKSVTTSQQAAAALTTIETAATLESAKIETHEADWKTVQNFVAEHRGKVVVVDIWSTACLPCMREFPNLIKLQKHYGKKIVCVSLNVDYVGIKSKPPAYYQPRVEKFLTGQKATIRNYICNVDAIELFDNLKLNSIPAVYVYDADGKLAKRFDDTLLEDEEDDAFTYEDDINPLIESLINKQ